MPLQPIPVDGGATVARPDAELQPGAFEVQLEVFSGPLGLLLHLIESQQLDVLTVPLADLADGYVGHLAAHPVAAEDLADFVSVAAQLILLKSRRLLPGESPATTPAEADEPDEGELRRRLLEYRALRDAARELGERDGVAPLFRREPRESDLPAAPAPALHPRLLGEALDRLAAIPEPIPPPPEVVPREVTIGMQIVALQAAMRGVGSVVLQQVLAACRSRTQVTVTLLAALELVRRRQVTMDQDELFGPITMRPVGDGGAS